MVIKYLLWFILLVLCWPLALLALVLYPVIWLFLLPFRLVGIAVDGVLALVRSIFLLPSRVLGGPGRCSLRLSLVLREEAARLHRQKHYS